MDARVGGGAEVGDGAVDEGGRVLGRAHVKAGVVGLLVAGGSWGAIRQGDWAADALAGRPPHRGGKRLGSNGVQQHAEGAALLHAARHREGGGVKAVEGHHRGGARQQQLHPRHSRLGEMHHTHHLKQPVIRLLKVEKDDAARLTRFLQVLHLLQVVQDVVANPAMRQEGGLRDINH